MTTLHPHCRDLQSGAPDVALALGEVGVRGVRRAIAFGDGARGIATIDVSVDLPAWRKGVHMSRFHEAIATAVDEAGAGVGGVGPDLLAARIATLAAELQGARRATAVVRAQLEIVATTPASGRTSFEPVDAAGHALVDAARSRVRRALEVHAWGINACPCAQELVRAGARERLLGAGFDREEADRALAAIPIATHNQRGTGTLVVGSEAIIEPAALWAVVRAAMSAPVSELLKRDDELHVVEAAHANPRFVEDCVRDMLQGALDAAWPLSDGDLVWARQVNHESIHAHDVAAERGALAGDLRRELGRELRGPATTAGELAPSLTPAAWLASA